MAILVNGGDFPGVCTMHVVSGFGGDGSHLTDAHMQYYRDRYHHITGVSEAKKPVDVYKALMIHDVKEHIQTARKARKAIVQATTTAEQTMGKAVLEACGFTLVMDAEDVKYPNSSKRLYLWALDLNKKAEEAIVVKEATNPFQQQQKPVEGRSEAPVSPSVAAEPVAVRPRLQNGRFMPAVGETFELDRARPIPTHWREAGISLRYQHAGQERDYQGIVNNARWWRNQLIRDRAQQVVTVRRLT